MHFEKSQQLIFWCFSILLILLPIAIQAQQNPEIHPEYLYSIGSKDVLTITVFNVPDLNTTVRVAEDGSVTLPLLGNIVVAGMTKVQLEQKLATLLESKYVRNPQVTVFIKEYQSNVVSVIGEVSKPGNYELIGRQTLLQIISLAGGLTNRASNRLIVIRQIAQGQSKSLVIDLDDLLFKGNPDLNIPLQAGDIVNIPAERFLDIYISGQVKSPGYLKVKSEGQVTLLRVIAQAGGFTERARESAVVITRKIDGKDVRKVVSVPRIRSGKQPDFIMENNDIVFVPESVL